MLGEKLKFNKRHTIHSSERNIGFFAGMIDQLLNIYHYRHVIYTLLPKRLTDRYHGSFLGIGWTLLNPLLTMLGLAIIFPLIAKYRVENYVVFLFSGILSWRLINGSILDGGNSILFSDGLIKQVYVPTIVFPFIYVSVELIDLTISLIALYILGLLLGFEITPNVTYLSISICITYIFCLGLGFTTSILVVYFRDIRHILGVILQALFFASAIFYPVSILPSKYQYYMEFNMFFQYIRLFQSSLYNTPTPEWGIFVIPIYISFSALLIGVYFQFTFSKKIIFNL